MNNDPWTHILKSLEPSYTELKILLETGPKIFADISQRGRYWCVTLQEQPLPNATTPIWSNPGKLDERVDWTLSQLDSWLDVKRMAHDMWYFKRKRDAEKFQTLYNLKWASE